MYLLAIFLLPSLLLFYMMVLTIYLYSCYPCCPLSPYSLIYSWLNERWSWSCWFSMLAEYELAYWYFIALDSYSYLNTSKLFVPGFLFVFANCASVGVWSAKLGPLDGSLRLGGIFLCNYIWFGFFCYIFEFMKLECLFWLRLLSLMTSSL